MKRLSVLLCALTLSVGVAQYSGAQTPRRAPQKPPEPSPIEKLGDSLFRVGRIRVDTVKREATIAGTVNPVTVLEFIANPMRGFKAYESALTLDTDAITFNAALALIGLDRSHSRAPTSRVDRVAVDGDPVEIWIDAAGPPPLHFRAERLAYDETTKQTIPDGTWLYTGSSFLRDGRYLADVDGVLIGFVHDPAPVIELAGGAGIGHYGSIVLNPNLGLAPHAAVTMTIKAVGAPPKPQ